MHVKLGNKNYISMQQYIRTLSLTSSLMYYQLVVDKMNQQTFFYSDQDSEYLDFKGYF